MDIQFDSCNYSEHIERKTLQIMMFVFNALNHGWTIEKDNNHYIFKKKHLGKSKVLKKKYLSEFIKENSKFNVDFVDSI